MSDTTPVVPDDAFGLLRSFTRHVAFVRAALGRVVHALEERAIVHDASKMSDDEFAGFSRINAAARINKFGSPEYSEGMRREKATLDLHFSRNSHHPEYPTFGDAKGSPVMGSEVVLFDSGASPRELNFLDVIEMVCDWWGARKGYDDPRPWMESVELNFEKKGELLTPPQKWLAREVALFLEGSERPHA